MEIDDDEELVVLVIRPTPTLLAKAILHRNLTITKACETCGQKIYVMRYEQKYCSANCRQKALSRSAEFKQKRADYMRERYRPKVAAMKH